MNKFTFIALLPLTLTDLLLFYIPQSVVSRITADMNPFMALQVLKQ